MNGHVLAGTPIAVDHWRLRECPHARVFFLTHMHADHTSGLTSAWHLSFYCSHVTKTLVIDKFGISEDLIIGLDLNTSHTIWLDEEREHMMTVSLVDANHCLGAIMILFQGYFGTFLYTGDFRYCERMLLEHPLLGCATIDRLYIDNTYCYPACEFGTREAAVLQMLKLIGAHPGFHVLIGMRTLGRESLLEHLAVILQTRIVVRPRRLHVLRLLRCLDVFTTRKDEGFIYAIPMEEITARKLTEANEVHPTIAIMPTALYCGLQTFQMSAPDIFVVPYSDHSPYNALHRFVSMLAPRRVIPIIKKSDASNMSCFSSYLEPSPCVPFEIPASVRRWMNCSDTARPKLRHPSHRRSTCSQRTFKVPKGVIYTDSASLEESIDIPSMATLPLAIWKRDMNDVVDRPKADSKLTQLDQIGDTLNSNVLVTDEPMVANAIGFTQSTVIVSRNVIVTHSQMSVTLPRDGGKRCTLRLETDTTRRGNKSGHLSRKRCATGKTKKICTFIKKNADSANNEQHGESVESTSEVKPPFLKNVCSRRNADSANNEQCGESVENTYAEELLGLEIGSMMSISDSDFSSILSEHHTVDGVHSTTMPLRDIGNIGTEKKEGHVPLSTDEIEMVTHTQTDDLPVSLTVKAEMVDTATFLDTEELVPQPIDGAEMISTSAQVVKESDASLPNVEAKRTGEHSCENKVLVPIGSTLDVNENIIVLPILDTQLIEATLGVNEDIVKMLTDETETKNPAVSSAVDDNGAPADTCNTEVSTTETMDDTNMVNDSSSAVAIHGLIGCASEIRGELRVDTSPVDIESDLVGGTGCGVYHSDVVVDAVVEPGHSQSDLSTEMTKEISHRINADMAKDNVSTNRAVAPCNMSKCCSRKTRTFSTQIAGSTCDNSQQVSELPSFCIASHAKTERSSSSADSDFDSVMFKHKVWTRRHVICKRNLMFLNLLLPLLDEQVAKRESDS